MLLSSKPEVEKVDDPTLSGDKVSNIPVERAVMPQTT